MKTNLVNLMNIVSDEERKFYMAERTLLKYAYTTSIKELDGTVNIIEDYKEDFTEEFEKYKFLQKDIVRIKAIINKKNNEFTLPDGRTIQEAIVDNSNLRKMKSFYESLLCHKSNKTRITEVNNSYFECKDINFDAQKIKEEYLQIEEKIQTTDFEIAKLNSIEFEI